MHHQLGMLMALLASSQVISTVLAHFTRGRPPLTLRAGTKVPADYWGKGGAVRYSLNGRDVDFTFPNSADGEMLVVKGELVTGVLDKAVFGKFGLVHAVQVACPTCDPFTLTQQKCGRGHADLVQNASRSPAHFVSG